MSDFYIHSFQEIIKDYLIHYQHYKEKSNAHTQAENWIDYIAAETQLIMQFGLPDKVDYHQNLWHILKNKNTPHLEQKIYTYLSSQAQHHLKATPTRHLQILEKAQQTQDSPYHILPEIHQKITSYTLYIYNHILLPHLDSAEHVLEEFRTINQLHNLPQLQLLCVLPDAQTFESLKALQGHPLRYLKLYLEWIQQKNQFPRNCETFSVF